VKAHAHFSKSVGRNSGAVEFRVRAIQKPPAKETKDTMTSEAKIVICGAGIGGLTAALALHQRGFDVTVFEQAETLSEVGAGLQLGANAVRVLSSLGLEERLIARASIPGEKQVRLWNTGKAWKLFDLGPASEELYGFPYLLMHRADLHDELRTAFEDAAPGRLVLGKRLSSIVEKGLHVQLHFQDGTSTAADAVVGADGVHSVIRAELFGGSDPKFSGCVAWRGVVPASDLPEHLRVPIGTNWIGPHGHVIQYPLRRGELINFVGIVERDDWDVESWTTPGDTDELAADFTGWHADVSTVIHSLDKPMKWALKLRPTMTTWSTSRVTLIGDACHPTLPFLAQGAGMAIEDGLVLARALEKYPNNAEAFAAYEQARMTRTTAVVDGSAANVGRFHNPLLSDPDLADQYVADEWSKEKVSERYQWLFEYNALEAEV
jgi:salicylate hydroxylase